MDIHTKLWNHGDGCHWSIARSWWPALLAPPLPGVTWSRINRWSIGRTLLMMVHQNDLWTIQVTENHWKIIVDFIVDGDVPHDFRMIFPWKPPIVDGDSSIGAVFQVIFPLKPPILLEFPINTSIYSGISHWCWWEPAIVDGSLGPTMALLSPPPWDRAVSSRMHLGENWGYGYSQGLLLVGFVGGAISWLFSVEPGIV